MTRALGYQKEVFNLQEVLEYFKASNYEDCRINAYPSFTKYDGINRTPSSFLMIDIDLKDFASKDKLDRAMNRVLKKIETVMRGHPTGIDFRVFDKDLQSLNLPSGERVVYTGYKGQKIADSDINKSKTAESFANLNSFKDAINGKSGSAIDTIDNTKMVVTYRPVNVFHNTWTVLLMKPLPP
jgi:hypothetical protein